LNDFRLKGWFISRPLPEARKQFEQKLVEKYLKIKTVYSQKRCIFVENLQDIKNQRNDVQ